MWWPRGRWGCGCSDFPCATWGRDDLGTGDMWNSNSLVSWLLARSRHEVSGLEPPDDGRAPGWSEWSPARSPALITEAVGSRVVLRVGAQEFFRENVSAPRLADFHRPAPSRVSGHSGQLSEVRGPATAPYPRRRELRSCLARLPGRLRAAHAGLSGPRASSLSRKTVRPPQVRWPLRSPLQSEISSSDDVGGPSAATSRRSASVASVPTGTSATAELLSSTTRWAGADGDAGAGAGDGAGLLPDEGHDDGLADSTEMPPAQPLTLTASSPASSGDERFTGRNVVGRAQPRTTWRIGRQLMVSRSA